MKMGDKGIKRRIYWFDRHKDDDVINDIGNKLNELFAEDKVNRTIAYTVDQLLETSPNMDFETDEERMEWETEFYDLTKVDIIVIHEVILEMLERHSSEEETET